MCLLPVPKTKILPNIVHKVKTRDEERTLLNPGNKKGFLKIIHNNFIVHFYFLLMCTGIRENALNFIKLGSAWNKCGSLSSVCFWCLLSGCEMVPSKVNVWFWPWLISIVNFWLWGWIIYNDKSVLTKFYFLFHCLVPTSFAEVVRLRFRASPGSWSGSWFEWHVEFFSNFYLFQISPNWW